MAKIKNWLRKENLDKITAWASDRTKSVSDIADLMGISASTLHLWLKEKSEIKEAFENGRIVVDDCAENQFMKMCFGYNVKIKKPHKVRRYTFDEKGRRVEEFEEFVQVEEEMHIPASWPALQVYLFNRMPDRYRPINLLAPPDDDEKNITGVVEMPAIVIPQEVEDAEIVEESSAQESSAQESLN